MHGNKDRGRQRQTERQRDILSERALGVVQPLSCVNIKIIISSTYM